MDLNRLTRGDQIMGISGIVLIIFSFFDWFAIGGDVGDALDAAGADTGGSAWDFTLTTIAVLIGIALTVYVLLKAFGVDYPALGSVSWAQIVLVAAVVCFAFVVIKLIVGVDVDTGGVDVDVDVDRKIGLFVGTVASAGLAAGAFLNFQEERAGGGATRPGTSPGPGAGPTV
jgi:hypothetical protein